MSEDLVEATDELLVLWDILTDPNDVGDRLRELCFHVVVWNVILVFVHLLDQFIEQLRVYFLFDCCVGLGAVQDASRGLGMEFAW